jgi:hypothetical protein
MTDSTKTDLDEQQKSFTEQREHARVSVVYSGKIFVGPKEIDCTIFNISAGGAKVYVKSPLEHAAVVTLKIDRFGSFHGRVVWSNGDRAGIKFLDDARSVMERIISS